MQISRRASPPVADVPLVDQEARKKESSPPPPKTSPASTADKVETVEDVKERVYQAYYSF